MPFYGFKLTQKRLDTKKTYKIVCDRFDLVYFGSVSQHSDEHQMVRGFTLSPTHTDRHYCVGTVAGKDVILLERTDTISFPDKPSKKYRWVVLQIDLVKPIAVHILLNGNCHDDTLYSTLLLRHRTMQLYDQFAVSAIDRQFASAFRVYAPLQHMTDIAHLLTPETASVLGHHFKQFDFELFHDRLLVLAQTDTPTPAKIEKMFQAGLWLADEINNRHPEHKP